MASILKGLGPKVTRAYLKKTSNAAKVSTTTGQQWIKACSKSLSTTMSVLSDSNSRVSDDNHQVVMTDDGRVIVCWHPEVPCPYEATKPIPLEAASTDQVLKVQALRPVKEIFRPKHERQVTQELMSLTYTAKYVWQPKPRRERYKEMNPLNQKRDREGL